MNKILNEYQIPGYKTAIIIVPREDIQKKGENKQTLQLELDFNTNLCDRKE